MKLTNTDIDATMRACELNFHAEYSKEITLARLEVYCLLIDAFLLANRLPVEVAL